VDNDGDGKIDWPNDPGCTGNNDNDEYNAPPPPPPPPPFPKCENLIDDDGDGLIDWPADPGCTEGPDNDEWNPPPAACNDGIDNDGDGKIDWPNDPGCTGYLDNDESDTPSPPPTPTPTPSTPVATDGIDTPGVVRNESGFWRWYLSNGFDASVTHAFGFHPASGTPVVGDWDGDGVDTPGINIGGNRWILTNGYDDIVDLDLTYGIAGDRPVVGDWDGDGIDGIGVVRGSTWYLKNVAGAGGHDLAASFGNPTDKAVAGDWDGNGTDTPGVVRNAVWWLSNDLAGTVWRSVSFGLTADQPLVGDWNGDGVDSPGVRRSASWYLSNGFTGAVDRSFVYGNAGDVGVAGDYHPEPVDSFTDLLEPMGGGASTVPTPVSRYAPRVWIHSADANRPASARSWFLRHAELKWAVDFWFDKTIAGRGQVRSIKLGAEDRNSAPYIVNRGGTNYATYHFTRPKDSTFPRNGAGLGEGFFLNVVGQGGWAGMPLLDLTQGRVPVYYHYRSRRFVTYWFFYSYNDGVAWGNHEGDWERISVKLNANNNATEVAMYRHPEGCYKTLPWSSVSKVSGTTHPVIYSSEGAHGSYSTAGDQFDTCTHSVIVDHTEAGHAWDTWKRLADVEKQPWYGFGGAWGEVGNNFPTDTTGPLGPSQYKPPAPAGW
jgi:hypothetical protein